MVVTPRARCTTQLWQNSKSTKRTAHGPARGGADKYLPGGVNSGLLRDRDRVARACAAALSRELVCGALTAERAAYDATRPPARRAGPHTQVLGHRGPAEL
eukprot:1676416-Prymnesium_polylepis.2